MRDGVEGKKEQNACPRSIQYTEAAARYLSPNYIQHSAHIEPGREGLFNLIKASPASLKCEPGVIVAEGDFVIVHGRLSGTGLPRNWIAADIVRNRGRGVGRALGRAPG
jgi:predicted SnoaL-like aldol condensation-catalyzing enzyme